MLPVCNNRDNYNIIESTVPEYRFASLTDFKRVMVTWYLTVRHDAGYSRCAPTAALVEHLRTFPELVAVGPMEFRNAPESPWVSVVLAQGDGTGSYAIGGDFHPAFNVVELVCGDGEEEWYESLSRRVAAFLDWEVVEEHRGRRVYPLG